jgi:hypothetical protein
MSRKEGITQETSHAMIKRGWKSDLPVIFLILSDSA